MERCSVSGSVASDILGVAIAAEMLSKNEGKIILDIAKDEANHRASASPI